MSADLHLGVALDGYGWHRQAWRGAEESVLSGETLRQRLALPVAPNRYAGGPR